MVHVASKYTGSSEAVVPDIDQMPSSTGHNDELEHLKMAQTGAINPLNGLIVMGLNLWSLFHHVMRVSSSCAARLQLAPFCCQPFRQHAFVLCRL